MQEVVDDEQEDAEGARDALGAMPMAGSAESKAGVPLESPGGSENVKSAVGSIESPGIGSDAWNEPIPIVIHGEEICVCASSCTEPCDMGWTVKGVVLMLEMSVLISVHHGYG
jgi:hypothetical protein